MSSVVCCQVEVAATSWSLFQRSPAELTRRCVLSRNLVDEEAVARTEKQSQRE
jgi:hypothetical protein